MFKKIEILSYKLGNIIGKNDTEDDKEIYGFALYAILSFLIYFVIRFSIIYLITGIWLEYIIIELIWLRIRTLCGGQHSDSPCHCFIISTIIYFVTLFISVLSKDYYILTFLIASATVVIAYEIIPKQSSYSEIKRSEIDKKKFRKKYIIRTLIIFIINLIIISIIYFYSLNTLNLFNISFNLKLISNTISCSLISCIFFC